MNDTDIPSEIIEAAQKIEHWMKSNGNDRWELLGLCSRNHAAELESLRTEVFDRYACAALTGMLSNAGIIAAIGQNAYINNTEDKVPRKITITAMHYATIALELRGEMMGKL